MSRCMVHCVMICALAGCATPPGSASRVCVDARRSIDEFVVEDPHTVVIEQTPSRRYRIHLSTDCPELYRARYLSLSNGFPRVVSYGAPGPVWGNTIEGSGHVCGFPGDDLVLHRGFDDYSFPQPRCRIQKIDRI